MPNVKTFKKSVDGNKNLSANFKVKEFACNDGSDTILIDLDMIPILQEIRNLGGVVSINSAYRTDKYNAKVGGATNSYHKYGRAFDIRCSGMKLDDICNVANTLGVKGIIRYSSFVHIDSRITTYHHSNVTGKNVKFEKGGIPFVSVLKIGNKSNETGLVQFKLNSLGYNCGNADGVFGNNTLKAIIAFQKVNGLSADGIVGKQTWSKLFA